MLVYTNPISQLHLTPLFSIRKLSSSAAAIHIENILLAHPIKAWKLISWHDVDCFAWFQQHKVFQDERRNKKTQICLGKETMLKESVNLKTQIDSLKRVITLSCKAGKVL